MSLEPSHPEMNHMTQPGPLPVGYVSKVPHDGSISEKDFRPQSGSAGFLILAGWNIHVFNDRTLKQLRGLLFLGISGE